VERYLRAVAARITARLTLPVGAFTRRLPDLFELLPPHHFAVTLGDETFPRDMIEECPESVIRESLSFPVWFQTPHVRDVSAAVFAAARPADPDLIWRLGFVFARQVYLVAAEPDDIQSAIDRHYGQTETESIDSYHVDYLDTALQVEFPGTEIVLQEDRRVN
jgi:hypothetical protein